MGQTQDAFGGLFRTTSRPSQKRGRPEELSQEAVDTLERIQKTMGLLTALSLRHESQLQAQASTDQFLMFFQMNQQGISPMMISHTNAWKKDMELNKAKKPLTVILLQLICQNRPGQNADICQAFATEPRMGAGGEESNGHCRREVALPSVVQRLQVPQAHVTACHRYGENAETPGRSGRGLAERAAHPPVQVSQEHFDGNQVSADLSLPAASLDEGDNSL